MSFFELAEQDLYDKKNGSHIIKNVNCYIDFEIPSEIIFNDLAKTYKEIADAKNSGRPREDEFWLTTFPGYAVKRFYFEDGDKAPNFKTEGKTENKWHFYSLISLLQVDYDLEYKELKRTELGGRLEYDPFGYPYGGVTGLIVFIEAFGCKPTKVDDGTGAYQVDWIAQDNFKLTEINERAKSFEKKRKSKAVELLGNLFKRMTRKH